MKLRTVIAALVLVVLGVGIWMITHGVRSGSTLAGPEIPPATDLARVDSRVSDSHPLDAEAVAAQRSTAVPTAPASQAGVEPAGVTARIEARVVDDKHKPIAGAKVSFSRATGTPASDADGRLVAEAKLRTAEIVTESLEFTAHGRATRSISANLQCSRTTYLGDVVLQRGGSVSGIVVDADGKPVARAEVGQEHHDGGWNQPFFRDPFGSIGDPKTESAADGSFHIDGMPIGSQHVIARRPSRETGSFMGPVLFRNPSETASSGDFEVRCGEETTGIRIALPAARPQKTVSAIVLDPDGAPVPRTSYGIEQKSESGSSAHNGQSDEQGRFKDSAEADGQAEIYARDDRGRWEDTPHVLLHDGDNDVTLQFTVARKMLSLTVTDEQGVPLEHWFGECRSPEGDHDFMEIPRGTHAGGTYPLGLPKVPFVIVAEASGREKATFGPFDPAALGPALTVVLRTQIGIRGRVVDETGPVANVPVRLYLETGAYTDTNGFVGVESHIQAGMTSREDGTFQFTPRENGRYTVRAEKSDRAPAQASGLDFDMQRGIGDLVLVFSSGGAIEGRMLAGPGIDATGSIVAASRGDAFSITQRVGPDGSFSFEHLVPGRWMVAATDKELREGEGADTKHVAFRPNPPSNCEVFEGQTTRFDLDRRESSRTCVLIGDLEFRGSNNSWTATFAGGDPLGSRPVGFGMWGHQFRLATNTPGAAVVLFTATGGDLEGTTLTAPVVLKVGETHWQLAADKATLGLHGSGSHSEPGIQLVLVTPFDDGSTFVRPLLASGDTSSEVPAGKGRVLWLDGSVRRDEDPRTWKGGVEVTLAPHEKISLERP